MDYVPFCGLPPAPDGLLARWTFDPVLLAGLTVVLGAMIVGGRADRRAVAGWGLAAILFVSPLCALSIALFSARVAQHVLLILAAAPLLATAWPRRLVPPPAFAGGLFAVLFWVWHLPMPYAATLASDLVYWGMHLSLLGAAVALWASLRRAALERPLVALTTLAATAAQMTLLAVLLVLAPRSWHAWHAVPAMEWGLTPLADQQLAGAIMWIGGGALTTLAVYLLARRFVAASDPATG
ncbi:MAG: cytochrome c oxidase assembly protein [Shimia sp.]